MKWLLTLRRGSPMLGRSPLTPLTLLTFFLLSSASLSSSCDVRNDLRGPARKTQHAPVVFAGRVRSRGAERHGFYQVTVDVESVVKGGAIGGGPLRLRFRRPAEDAAAAAARRPACVAEALVETGERYIVFVKAVGGPRNFTAVTAPEVHSKRNMRKVTRVLRKRRGRSPPRVAKMKSIRLPAGRRVRLLCKVRGSPLPRVSWFKDGEPLNETRRIRIRTKKKKRRLQSQLIFRRLVPSDSAFYECRARNRAGKDSKRARVSVVRRRRPRPTLRPRPTGPDKPRPRDSWRAAEPCDIPSYCLNGGSCTLYRSVMEYVCRCAEGFKGKRCERKTVYAIKQRPDEPVLLAAQYQPLMLVLGGLTILLLLLVLVAVLCRRQSRSRGRPKCGNGAVAMATGQTSAEPAAAAAAAVNGRQPASVDRTEQVSCRPSLGTNGPCTQGTAVPLPLPSPSRRPSPAGADGAAGGEGAPEPEPEPEPEPKPESALPSAASVRQLEDLLNSLVPPPDSEAAEDVVHTKDT